MTAAARALADRDDQRLVESGGLGDVATDGPPAPPSDLSGPGAATNRFDVPSAFEPMDDHLGHESTPALLAAKAEPLGQSTSPRPSRPRSGRPGRATGPGRPPRAGSGPTRTRSRSQARRPNDSSKAVIGIGVVAVVLVGIAAFFFMRGGDGDEPVLDEATESTPVADSVTSSSPATDPVEEVAAPTAAPPAVIFDEAAIGPIQADTEYTIAVGEGPASAQYRLLVDGEPQTEPAPELPPVTFTPGRHVLVIEITSPEGDTATNPVLVYAIGPIPEASYRANLSSVDIEAEGWAEAVRQFDEFVAAGHTDLQLMPSDWFENLVPGYWNLYVDGFATATEALEYCASHGLAVPDDCFAVEFDPGAAVGA
jgi:hypothetical protein